MMMSNSMFCRLMVALFAHVAALCGSVSNVSAKVAILCDKGILPCQSIYKFDVSPEYMLLNVDGSKSISGHTATLFEDGKHQIVIGKFLTPGKMTLLFFPPEALAISGDHAKAKPAHVVTYEFLEADRVWTSNDASTEDRFSRFRLLWNGVTGGADYQLVGREIAPRLDVFNPQIDLFRASIIQLIVGLPSTRIHFKESYCAEMRKSLEKAIKQGGNWDVDIDDGDYMSFHIKLRSHSDREHFYKDGHWWRAFVEVKFADYGNQGKCDGADVAVYDTLVCTGPINDDPDGTRNRRRDCYRRIEPSSKAEYELRDRLTAILRKAYGLSPR